MDISQHCDISTCRRAIKLLNEDRSLPHKIEPIISNRIRKQIERKEAVKRKTSGKYLKRTGKFQITFT